MKVKQEFEKWYKGKYPDYYKHGLKKHPDSSYISETTYNLYIGFVSCWDLTAKAKKK